MVLSPFPARPDATDSERWYKAPYQSRKGGQPLLSPLGKPAPLGPRASQSSDYYQLAHLIDAYSVFLGDIYLQASATAG